MNIKSISAILAILLLIGTMCTPVTNAIYPQYNNQNDYDHQTSEEIGLFCINGEESTLYDDIEKNENDKAPNETEKNIFDIMLKRFKSNPNAIPNSPVNGKVDDALGTLAPNKWEKTWDCKNPPPAKCQVVVQTKLVTWCTSDGKPKNSAGNYTVEGFTDADFDVETTEELKKITITVEMEFNSVNTSAKEGNYPGQVNNVGLLYHELLHIQMMIDEIKSSAWQDDFCECIDAITKFSEHESLIKVLQPLYNSKLWDIINDRMNNEKEAWSVCSKPAGSGSNHIIASPYADIVVDINLKQDGIVNIVEGIGNSIDGPISELVNTIDPIKTYEISIIDIRENISSVYTENVTWPISLKIFYHDEDIPHNVENNLGVFSKIDGFWIFETDSRVNTDENYVEVDVNHLNVLSLALHGKTIYVDDDGGADYTRIQDAIDYANSGDKIFVYEGVYNENIVIEKIIDLEGEYSGVFDPNGKTSIIDGGGTGNVITAYVDNVDIHGFVIQNCGSFEEDAGVDIRSNNNTIYGNIISNNGATGIYLHDSANGNIIYGNDITNNDGAGIFIWDSSNNNLILNNNLADNSWYNAKDKCDNIWDYGYPVGGNYWDDYNGQDNYHGPYQNISGSDGIGDIPYEILDDTFNGGNEDSYPFISSYGWNKPPNSPIIDGITNGNPGINYQFTFYLTEHHYQWFTTGIPQIYLYVEWGDGTNSSWLGPYISDSIVSLSHNWSEKGNYLIKVKTKDNYGSESNWASLEVSMPKNKSYINTPFARFLESYPYMFPILRRLMEV